MYVIAIGRLRSLRNNNDKAFFRCCLCLRRGEAENAERLVATSDALLFFRLDNTLIVAAPIFRIAYSEFKKKRQLAPFYQKRRRQQHEH